MLIRAKRSALALSIATAFAANAPAVVFAQAAADPLNVLIDQGKYWQAHKRGDLAEQAWQKVLRIDPKQPDALFGMGMVLADRKDGSGAQQYLARLREVAPNYPSIDELGRRLGETSARDQTVNDARRLAQSGQSASAVEEYKRAIEGKPSTPGARGDAAGLGRSASRARTARAPESRRSALHARVRAASDLPRLDPARRHRAARAVVERQHGRRAGEEELAAGAFVARRSRVGRAALPGVFADLAR
jgi:tetratricopeptide (TPR) repeat protein